MALPYTTELDVVKICKQLIAESGGSQPQPGPGPEPVPEHYNDFQGLEDLINYIATDPTEEINETFEFNYDNVDGEPDKLLTLLEGSDASAIEKLFVDCHCLSSDLYVTQLYENYCQSGKVNLLVGLEVDTEDPQVIAKYLPIDNVYHHQNEILHVEGTIKINYKPWF